MKNGLAICTAQANVYKALCYRLAHMTDILAQADYQRALRLLTQAYAAA